MINWKVITRARVIKRERLNNNHCCGCLYDTHIYFWQIEQCQFMSEYEIMFHPKSNFFNKIALYIKLKHTKWEIRVIYTQKLAEKLKIGCLKSPFYLTYLIENVNNPSPIDIFE